MWYSSWLQELMEKSVEVVTAQNIIKYIVEVLKHMFTNNEVDTNSKVHFSIDNLKMINNVKAMNDDETQYKKLTINNIKEAFKIDTGTNINVLPIQFINKNIEQKIERKIIKLYAFGGTYIKVIGKEVNLNYNINKNINVIKTVTFVVIIEKSATNTRFKV